MEQNYCVFCSAKLNGAFCASCGRKQNEYQPAPHHLQPGTILAGKYTVGGVLGEGGFGITYIGRDMILDIAVAIKEYFPSGVVNRNNTISAEITSPIGDAVTFFENGKKKFLDEARILAKFSNEQSIVSVRDFFSENNTAYIVMEYLEGVDLKTFIEKNGAMDFKSAVDMLSPVMTALSKIHSQGLIHRDISPSNIMILNDGTVKLLDFGAAREVSGADEKSLSILLKPGYAPEEQYRTKGKQGPWTDVYAISATMYKMLTGITPDDAMNRLFSDDIKTISEFNPSVNSQQESIIFKGMEIHQENRYQNISELHDDCLSSFVSVLSFADVEMTQSSATRATKQTEHRPYVKTEDRTKKENVNTEKKQENKQEKPNVFFLIGAIVAYFLFFMCLSSAVSNIIEEIIPISSGILTVAFAGATFFLGKKYFSKINNKERKPNVICLIANILSSLLTIFCAWVTYNAFSSSAAEPGDGAATLITTICSLALPILFGYFYYPRLERKKRKFFVRLYSGLVAAAVAVFIIGVVSTSVNTVTIGDENIERDATIVELYSDLITNNDLEKLKELKNLESLKIFASFLDDASVKIIGEVTWLKELSIAANPDVTDISPLSNLQDLTFLDVSNTKVTDISCLSNLVNLRTLHISNTKVTELSCLEKFVALDTLHMDYLGQLNAETILLPKTITTLYCNGNKLESLAFVAKTDALLNLYAKNNNISDLSPLSKYSLYIADLSVNNINDLSHLKLDKLDNLDVSTNQISDISCLIDGKFSNLDVSYNNISDISALANNYHLWDLDINHNKIADITPIKECYKLYKLNISYNNISDIGVLYLLEDLTHFEARGNQIVDISPLSACEILIDNGNAIDLRDNKIANIEALSKYSKTSHIYLSGNKISDISPLKHCTKLELLKINNNEISDISSLGLMDNLNIVEIVNNPISNVDNFILSASRTNVLKLNISYNESIDFSMFLNKEKLSVIIYDAPPRARDALIKEGLRNQNFVNSKDNILDAIQQNEDLEKEDTAEDNNNG